ncbi:hypothetical protein ACFOD0_13785 [Shewanella intestini]|uniref:Extradiol ring-cleavage dioxygenase LigAB LigA subunit domain-containing protein n=1 Tax=Shewanella intestini TaxID=2017544 RepID=A0ABS5I2L4_9GAMM|nr:MULTISPECIES: hypothetical protein [Shewanella]MBR9728267.1 hypothetical protein [Shewanella intestini]MRG35732.1 hypothetical protein [Shewanella sp. XMDDZSB0408]
MSTLTDFFTALNQDAKMLENYKKDPRAVMQQYGLSAAEISAVLSGDANQVKSLTGDTLMKSYMLISNPTQ